MSSGGEGQEDKFYPYLDPLPSLKSTDLECFTVMDSLKFELLSDSHG